MYGLAHLVESKPSDTVEFPEDFNVTRLRTQREIGKVREGCERREIDIVAQIVDENEPLNGLDAGILKNIGVVGMMNPDSEILKMLELAKGFKIPCLPDVDI